MAKRKRSYAKVVLIALAVVLFWRGSWGLMDLYIFPDNEVVSYIASIVVGLVVLYFTHKLDDELL